VGGVRRRDLADSGLLTVVGKGGKTRMFRVPDEVLWPLAELDKQLRSLGRRRHRGAAPVNRYQRLLEPDAPLVPALKLWGRNQGQELSAGEMRGLSRSGIAMTLRRAAEKAGIEPGSPDFGRIHPHGIRHLAGKWAQQRGVPLNIIQAVMGHSSLSTTGQYVEEHDPARLCLSPAEGRQEAPRGAASEPPPVILDAVAEPVPSTQRSATAKPEQAPDTEPAAD
jgi:integrase